MLEPTSARMVNAKCTYDLASDLLFGGKSMNGFNASKLATQLEHNPLG